MSAAGASLARAYPRLVRHRLCEPADRQAVLTTCLYDRSVLPRWHQEDRGRGRGRYGHHEYAPDGAYRGVLVWRSRSHWYQFAAPVAFAAHRDLARRHHISLPRLLAVCRVKSGYANARTGRRCIVKPEVLASVLGVTKRTVQNYNAFMRAAGLERVILQGRMLSKAEKLALWHAGRRGRGRGSRQRGLSTEVALTMSREIAAATSHFTPGSTSGTTPRNLTSRTAPHSGGATSEPTPSAQSTKRARSRPPTAGLRLAKDLQGLQWWLRRERPARMAPALQRFATATPAWTATDLTDALSTVRARAGIHGPIDPAQIRTTPAVVLAYWLRQIDPIEDHPRVYDLRPEQLRCGRAVCDHGWVSDPAARVMHDALGWAPPPVTRCDQCRPGAWTERHDEDEAPF